jgi:hypothetical protein
LYDGHKTFRIFLFVTYIIILLVPIPGFLLVRFLVRFVLDIVVIRLPIQMVWNVLEIVLIFLLEFSGTSFFFCFVFYFPYISSLR